MRAQIAFQAVPGKARRRRVFPAILEGGATPPGTRRVPAYFGLRTLTVAPGDVVEGQLDPHAPEAHAHLALGAVDARDHAALLQARHPDQLALLQAGQEGAPA